MQNISAERIWLVDEKDQPVGEGWQLRDHSPNNSVWQNFRVVNVFVKNSRGQIWFPRRASHKRIFPNCLDMSMGGHVDFPETYEQAFARELKEELNIEARDVHPKLLGYLTPKDHPSLSAFMKVWEIEMEETPRFNPDDFSESFWFSSDEFRVRVKSGEGVKGDLPKLVDIFYPSNV